MNYDKEIIFAVTTLSNGGAERVVSVWSNEFSQMKIKTHLLLLYREEEEYKIDDNIKIHSLAENKEEFEKLSLFRMVFMIRKILKEIGPDIVITFLYHTGILTSAARIGLDIKHVETIRNYPSTSPEGKVKRILRNVSIFFSDSLILQTKEQGEYFPDFILRKAKIFPNPISKKFYNVNLKNKEPKINNIIAVGRLIPFKNHRMLIKAFSKLNNENMTLSIFGEGKLDEELKSLISNLSLDKKVTLYGRSVNIADKLKKADLYVLTSNHEGMPNSLMEAMAVGLPVISTDCPTGPSDLIRNGKNGLLIPMNNEKSLIDAINYLKFSPEKAKNFGKQAKEDMRSYSPLLSAKKLYKYLEDV